MNNIIRRSYYTDTYACMCPECCERKVQLISCKKEDKKTIREYECLFCGTHWEIEWDESVLDEKKNKNRE